MKRFYKQVSLDKQDGKYVILLDGKVLRTPEKEPCLLPAHSLADAICTEWMDQKEEILPATMPMTKLANTAIDRVAKRNDEITEELVKYASSDQLCYRAENPAELVDLQNRIWDPLLDWMDRENNVKLNVTNGIVFVGQDENEIIKFKEILEKVESFELTALYNMITVTGSTVVGLALFQNYLSVQQAWDAGHLDENFQVTQWGCDEEAEARRQNLKKELNDADRFLALCRAN